MQIHSGPRPFFYPIPNRMIPARSSAADSGGWNALLGICRRRHCHETLLQAWRGFLGRPDPGLRGVHELRPGQRLGAALVDAGGGISVSCGGQALAVVAVSGPQGTVVGAVASQGVSGGLRIADGHLELPDGTSIPFGNRGVIVRLPDGTQVAVGRSGDGPQDRACRWVVAGPGEEIPTSPPGATAVYEWDGSGGLKAMGSV